jgi:hypothetical protein
VQQFITSLRIRLLQELRWLEMGRLSSIQPAVLVLDVIQLQHPRLAVAAALKMWFIQESV